MKTEWSETYLGPDTLHDIGLFTSGKIEEEVVH